MAYAIVEMLSRDGVELNQFLSELEPGTLHSVVVLNTGRTGGLMTYGVIIEENDGIDDGEE